MSLSIFQASGSPATHADALAGTSATSLGLAIAGADQSIRSANHAFVDIAGGPVERVIGARLSFLYQDGDGAACAEPIGRAFASRQEYSAQLRAVRGNGEHFIAEIAVIPVSDAAGGLLHFVVVLRDVSTVSTVETALAATNRRLHELLDHLPAGVVVHDQGSRVLQVNALAARLLGRSVDQLLGLAADHHAWRFLRADGSVMPPEEYPVNQTLRTRSNLSSLVVGGDRGAPLGLVWVICNTYLVCDEGGELSEAVVCFTDYTELKHAEQALQKSEERLRLVLQGANDAAWDWDLRTNELYYSPRWWAMIGREPGELPADSDLWRRLTHPDDAERLNEAFARALAGTGHTYEIEFRLQHKDGRYVPFSIR